MLARAAHQHDDADPDGDRPRRGARAAAPGGRDQSFRLTRHPRARGQPRRSRSTRAPGPRSGSRSTTSSPPSPRDRHYVLNRTTGEVRFGDGRNGAIPIANVANPGANVVARRYRYGGGTHGNVGRRGAARAAQRRAPASTRTASPNLVASLRRPRRGDPRPGQADGRRPRSGRGAGRSPSDDFEFFAQPGREHRAGPGAAAAAPRLPRTSTVPGVVTVVVVPDSADPEPRAQRGHAAHGLRLPGPAPAAHHRAVRRTADLPGGQRRRRRWSPTTPPTWPRCSATSSGPARLLPPADRRRGRHWAGRSAGRSRSPGPSSGCSRCPACRLGRPAGHHRRRGRGARSAATCRCSRMPWRPRGCTRSRSATPAGGGGAMTVSTLLPACAARRTTRSPCGLAAGWAGRPGDGRRRGRDAGAAAAGRPPLAAAHRGRRGASAGCARRRSVARHRRPGRSGCSTPTRGAAAGSTRAAARSRRCRASARGRGRRDRRPSPGHLFVCDPADSGSRSADPAAGARAGSGGRRCRGSPPGWPWTGGSGCTSSTR